MIDPSQYARYVATATIGGRKVHAHDQKSVELTGEMMMHHINAADRQLFRIFATSNALNRPIRLSPPNCAPSTGCFKTAMGRQNDL
jgi:hypothetical protein